MIASKGVPAGRVPKRFGGGGGWLNTLSGGLLYQMVLKNYFKQYLVPFQFFEGHRR